MGRKDKKVYSCGGFGYDRPANAPCGYSYCNGEQYENRGSAPDHCPICGAPMVPQTKTDASIYLIAAWTCGALILLTII